MKYYKSIPYLFLFSACLIALLWNVSLSLLSKQKSELQFSQSSFPTLHEKRQLIATLQRIRMHNVTRNQRSLVSSHNSLSFGTEPDTKIETAPITSPDISPAFSASLAHADTPNDLTKQALRFGW